MLRPPGLYVNVGTCARRKDWGGVTHSLHYAWWTLQFSTLTVSSLFYLSTFLIKGNHLTQSFKKLNSRFGDVLVSQEVLLTFPRFEQDCLFCRSLFGCP